MEVPGMEEAKPETHMISAAAFVEGGIQKACDDACSICLEDFSESDPSTLTTCKHDFHLQCILEWCQRSSQCPMCWQLISLKDPTSQESLEAVVRERSFRVTPPRNATIFLHPTLGDFELQHLPLGANDAELEERIIQHLAAAAAMGRANHMGRREGQRGRSSPNGHRHILVFSTHPGGPPSNVSASGGDDEPAAISGASPSTPLASGGDDPLLHVSHIPSVHTDQVCSPASGSAFLRTNRQGIALSNRSPASYSSPPTGDRAGPSDFQSFSESVKSRFNTMSMRYKESFSKSTRGWKERLFSRSTSMTDIGPEVQREVNAGIASVSRMMEHLETRESSRASQASVANHFSDISVMEQSSQNIAESGENPLHDGNQPAPCAASSASTNASILSISYLEISSLFSRHDMLRTRCFCNIDERVNWGCDLSPNKREEEYEKELTSGRRLYEWVFLCEFVCKCMSQSLPMYFNCLDGLPDFGTNIYIII